MGGFVPVDYDFADLPSLLVTGDGRVIEQGPQIEIYPGPLLPNVLQRTISEAGIQALLRLAEEHDLFRDVEYEDATNIADAPFTVVTISANGATYEHNAYALGLGGDGTETDEARANLAVVRRAGERRRHRRRRRHARTGGAVRGDVVPDPGHGRRRVRPRRRHRTDDGRLAGRRAGPPRRRLRVRHLAGRRSFADLFASANQLTWFVEDGITYQLVVKPQLPGVPAC